MNPNNLQATGTTNGIVTVFPQPDIEIVKSVTPLTRPEPGGSFTYDLLITNPGPIDIVITSLIDNVYGDLGNPANPLVQPSTCDELIGDTLTANGGSTTCTFVGVFTGVAGDTETDTVTVVGTDANNNTATDSDDATVTLVPAPDIEIVKSVTPPSRPEPGGAFTYDLLITNPGPIDIVITSLVDDVYGNLGDPANPLVQPSTCDELIGDTLTAGGGSTTCTFVGVFTGDAGDSETDTVTVVGTDANNNTATDSDDATVTLVPAPDIEIVKTVTPLTRPEPGGNFTYNLVITNPGPIDIVITSLVDDVYGDLGNPANPLVQPSTCDELIGDTLTAGGGSTTCTFVGVFTGDAGDSETDIVTVVGTDANDNTATDSDDATVTLVPAPDIEIVKTVTPPTRPEPGGDFTYDLVITNPGPIDIVITSLVDDVYGDLGNPANPLVQPNTCDELIGDTLTAGGGSTTCTFVGVFTGDAGDSETDIVTVVGTDANNNTATDSDDATVTLVPAPDIEIVKTVTPLTRPEPGGNFTYNLVITNPGPIDIVITSLVDDVYGDLGNPANPAVQPSTCDELIGDTLAAGTGSATCTFVGVFTGDAGDTETDTVTVVGTDANNNTATDQDDATVTLVPMPDIEIVKSVTPASLPQPGGAFTYDLVITNPGPIDIVITSLVDDVYGDLGDPANPLVQPSTCDELIGDTLVAVAGSATCRSSGRLRVSRMIPRPIP